MVTNPVRVEISHGKQARRNESNFESSKGVGRNPESLEALMATADRVDKILYRENES